MNERSQIKGLLIYSFHAASGNLAIILIAFLGMAAGLLITGNGYIYLYFGMIAINAPVYAILSTLGKTRAIWERFQIAMPVKRSSIVSLKYLQVILASLIGIPLFTVIAAMTFAMHEGYPDFSIAEISPYFSISLLMSAFLLPLACTKIGENRQDSLFLVCFFVAFVIVQPLMGTRLGIPRNTAALLVFAISAIAFIISIPITKRLYSRKDF